MPNFAANLSMLWTELPFLDRFDAAAKAGFKGIEFLFPYAERKESIAEKLKKHGFVQALFNMPPGNWEAGERGMACLPDRVGEFRDGVGLAIDYAKALDCRLIHCMAGLALKGAAPEKLRQTYVANLRFAAAEAKKS